MMKKPFFRLTDKTRRAVFFVFHGGLFLALGLSVLVIGPLRVNTSLFDILPAGRGDRSLAAADALLGEKTGRQAVILACAEEFGAAKAGAEELYAALTSPANTAGAANPAIFDELSLRADGDYLSRFAAFRHDYRFMLLDRQDRALVENGGAREIAGSALASVYGVFSMASLDKLDEDPFLLAGRGMQNFLESTLLSGSNLFPRDDVLAAEYEGNWYVMLRGTLASGGVAITNRESAVQKIYAAADKVRAAHPGLRFYCSGVPFHSYESSSSAQKEISLISTISLIAVLLLFLRVYRSPVPVLASLAALGLSLLSALCASLLFFRGVHVLSFVFGTTLIGTCVDYSIHFFTYRIGLPDLDGAAVRARIFRGIGMSFVSTVICFAALLFAPFAILKQFAVFLLAGLASSFLSVTCIYPGIWRGKSKALRGRGLPLLRANIFPQKLAGRKPRLILFAALLAALAGVLVVNRVSVRIENRLGDLYSMPQSLAESERINARVLDYGSAGWYFIVSGNTAEETLRNEERLTAALDGEIKRGNLGSFMATSLFIPSRQTQRESYLAAEKLLPLLDAQCESLGLSPEEARAYRETFAAAGERYLLPGGDGLARELTANVWIGQAGEKYYSCVLPLHAKDEEPFRRIASETEGVYFLNKVKDMGAELDRLTKIMLFLLAAAFAAVIIFVRFAYSWKKTLRICAVPLAITLAVLAVLSVLNIPLGFFSMVGLLLVFGLGLDYIFYSVEAENSGAPLTALAILLSFVTTALSFGALALSSFVPVHIFGVTVFSGLAAAYCASRLVSGDNK